jgi:hypothetical protein
LKNGQKKCPKMKIPKYFAQKYQKNGPTCEGNLFDYFFTKNLHGCREKWPFWL